MFSIQDDWNVKMIKRLHIVQNTKKLLNFQIWERKAKSHMKGKKHIKNAETIQSFLEQQRKQMTKMKYLLLICQIRHKFKQTKLKKLNK